MSDITREQLVHLAELAHLDLTEEELDRVSGELDGILKTVERVQEIRTEEVPATSHPVALHNVFRDDVVRGVLEQQQALASAPETESGQFKVPAILDGGSES
ncbi:Asp-tRNA(Asn)/Glu-tRNA(Gln) amidotransferase subunit GatC [Yaniella flava]|uniref:Aspartyl/glutamyl-tRNA(Asn/Gln) amidotransferase subunit C n=1 Tax=Yaniella flava TaxID=287930 RepID=A0ABP5FFN9_9MICC|nr:Asp-tRNA(Asn)/Glu-tRNA(Gln) amidotransferase subunit GatC [Micrococcaceae bacterium]